MNQPSFFSSKRVALLLFGIAVIARILICTALYINYGPGGFYLDNTGAGLIDNDSQHYVAIAKNIVEHGEYSRFPDAPYQPDSYRTPLMVLYFVPFIAGMGLGGITFAMYVLQIFLAFTAVVAFAAARLLLPASRAFWVGLLAAIHPLLVYRSGIAEPDALAVLLLLVALYYFVRFWKNSHPRFALLTGLSLGLLILTKPVGVYVSALFGVCMFVKMFSDKTDWRRILKTAGIFFVVIGICVVPWLVRNYRVFGVWGVSSVTGYNLYSYYTKHISLPDEQLPDFGPDRDPVRNLSHQELFIGLAKKRIAAHPAEYVLHHASGTIRTLFASDLAGIYYSGHSKLLPAGYDPRHAVGITPLLLSGNFRQALAEFFAADSALYLLRHLMFAILYIAVIYRWAAAWKQDRGTFMLFSFFLILSAYFVATPGPFVDAKYRLSALPLLAMIALYPSPQEQMKPDVSLRLAER